MSSTPFLFYGPNALESASDLAAEIGEPMDPVGKGGLKVKDSRDLVEMSMEGVVGARPPVAIVGPLDLATYEASDALLKTLEEVEGSQLLRFVLWSNHLHGVPPTIQSRCNCVWSGQDSSFVLEPEAVEFLGLYLDDKKAEAISVLMSKKDWLGFLSHVVEAMASDLLESDKTQDYEERSFKITELWERVRPLLGTRPNCGPVVAVATIFCGLSV